MRLVARLITLLVFAAVTGSLALGEPAPALPLNQKSDYKIVEKQIQKVIADARKTVVHVKTTVGQGSGTIISEDGWVATAAHVIRWGSGMQVTVTLEDNRKYQGESIGATTQRHGGDYGLVKVDTKGDKLPFARLGESGKFATGDWLIAMGHPYGMIPGRGPVVRAGRMLGLIRDDRIMVTDAPLIYGDSGGGVFDLSGALIASNSEIEGNINFVAPVDGFKAIFERLKAGEVIDRDAVASESESAPETAPASEPAPARGMNGRRNGNRGDNIPKDIGKDVRKDHVSLLELWTETGTAALRDAVFIIRNDDGKQLAFATAVRKDGYLITKASELGGATELEIVDDDGTAIAVTMVGEDKDADVALLKADTTLRTVVTFDYSGEEPVMGMFLASVNAEGHAFTQGVAALNSFDSNVIGNQPYVGFTAEDCEEGGILITSVAEGSPSEAAGIQIGDILLKFDESDIESFMGLVTMVYAHQPGEQVIFTGLRDDQPKTFEMTLEARMDMLGRDSQEQRAPQPWQVQDTPKLGATLKERDDTKGLEITEIKPDTPAADAGLQAGDIIRRANRTDVTTLEEMKQVMNDFSGGVLRLGITRIGEDGTEKKRQVAVRLGQAPGTVNKRADCFGPVTRHDGNVLPDQCGAPIVDLDGHIRGLNIARSDRTSTFALPAKRVHDVVEQLLQTAAAESK